MSIDVFFRIAERFGVPVGLLMFFGFAAVLIIKGPMMKFAEIVGAPLAQLVRSAIHFVTAAATKLDGIETAVKLEAERTRREVAEQAAQTREHMGALAENLRDRVSAADRAAAERAVTGPHPAIVVGGIEAPAPSSVEHPPGRAAGITLPSIAPAPAPGPASGPRQPAPSCPAAFPVPPRHDHAALRAAGLDKAGGAPDSSRLDAPARGGGSR